MKYMNVTAFLLSYPVFALLITWRAVLLWKGRVALYTGVELQSKTPFLRVLRRYESSIPSLAWAVWSFIPTALFTHFSEQGRGLVSQICSIVRWPCWIATGGFVLCAILIQMSGAPQRLVPPNMRGNDLLG